MSCIIVSYKVRILEKFTGRLLQAYHNVMDIDAGVVSGSIFLSLKGKKILFTLADDEVVEIETVEE